MFEEQRDKKHCARDAFLGLDPELSDIGIGVGPDSGALDPASRAVMGLRVGKGQRGLGKGGRQDRGR